MENSKRTTPWQWDDRREDWYYYDGTKGQWVYGNGRVYPEPGQTSFSPPIPEYGTSQSRYPRQPQALQRPNYDSLHDSASPIARSQPTSRVFPGLNSPSYSPPSQQQLPWMSSSVDPRPHHAYPVHYPQDSYQCATPALYLAPHLSENAEYYNTGESDDDRQRDDQNDRNRHGRSHWQDNNPPTNGGHPTGGDHKDNEEETQGARLYTDSQYDSGVAPHYNAPLYSAGRMNVSQ